MMDALFKKLNYKNQPVVVILNAPESFDVPVSSLEKAKVFREILDLKALEFVIGFATNQQQLDEVIHQVAPLLEGDAIFWMAYPKGTSKKYTCDFNRDTGWKTMGQYNLEPVRQVAIDEDWSALRFRKVEFIKTLTRNANMILSEKGKERING